MDKLERIDLADWLAEHSEAHNAQRDLLLRARMGLVLQAIEARWGPLGALQDADALVSFVAEPVSPDAWRSGDQRARLREVRLDAPGLGVSDGQPPDELLAACWRLLCDLTDAWRHGAATHAGFVLALAPGTVACWHVWTCQDCATTDPCFALWFGQGEAPSDGELEAWDDPAEVTQERMRAAGVPIPCAVFARWGEDHHRVA